MPVDPHVPEPKPPAEASSFAPLRQPVFAVLWFATVLGNIGSLLLQAVACWWPCTLQSLAQAQSAARRRIAACIGLPSLSPHPP